MEYEIVKITSKWDGSTHIAIKTPKENTGLILACPNTSGDIEKKSWWYSDITHNGMYTIEPFKGDVENYNWRSKESLKSIIESLEHKSRNILNPDTDKEKFISEIEAIHDNLHGQFKLVTLTYDSIKYLAIDFRNNKAMLIAYDKNFNDLGMRNCNYTDTLYSGLSKINIYDEKLDKTEWVFKTPEENIKTLLQHYSRIVPKYLGDLETAKTRIIQYIENKIPTITGMNRGPFKEYVPPNNISTVVYELEQIENKTNLDMLLYGLLGTCIIKANKQISSETKRYKMLK